MARLLFHLGRAGSLRVGPDAYAFGNEAGERVGRITTAWNAACRRAGVTDLHFHDLRHEFISRMLEAGVAIHNTAATRQLNYNLRIFASVTRHALVRPGSA